MTTNSSPILRISQGQVFSIPGGSHALASAVTLQADGKILVAGPMTDFGVMSGNALVARFNANGSLDSSFGSGTGYAVIPDQYIGPDNILVSSTGEVFVAGFDSVGNGPSVITCFAANGVLDSGFGTGGKVLIDPDYTVLQLTLHPQGGLLVLGSGQDGADRKMMLFKCDEAGNPDEGFGDGGRILIPVGTGDSVESVVIQGDGKIVVASAIGLPRSIFLVRYDEDGVRDTSFGNAGEVLADFGLSESPCKVLLQEDGKLLVVGTRSTDSYSSDGDILLIRYNDDGSLDTSFGGGDGVVVHDLGFHESASDVDVQPDGKIIVAGSSSERLWGGPASSLLVRYNEDGSLDTSFGGGDGFTRSSLIVSSDQLLVLPNGQYLVTGNASNGNGEFVFGLARYNADGTLDAAFGGHQPVFREGGAAVVLDSAADIHDAELFGTSYDGVSLSLSRHGGPNVEDVFSGYSGLEIGATGGLVKIFNTVIGTVITRGGGVLKLVFNENASEHLVEEALSRLTYSNVSAHPPNTVAIDWKLNDGNTGEQGSGGAKSSTSTTIVKVVSIENTYTGTSGNDVLTGSSGFDELLGLSGSDTLNGGAGNDLLIGDYGNDRLNGGAGNDMMKGGMGNDIYHLNSSGDKVVELVGEGVDTVESSMSWVLGAHLEKLILTGVINANGTGNSLGNILVGNNGHNILNGAGGNDILIGGRGTDSLIGGAGKDSFRFNSLLDRVVNVDTIKDFSSKDDVIQLNNAIFKKLGAAGQLKAAYFKASTTGKATDSNDYIVYETDSGKLFYDADGSGKGAAIQFALIGAHPKIDISDFLVI